MNAISSEAPARDLIAELFASDAKTAGRPVLPPTSRSTATMWLERVLVDFEALERHLDLLSTLYGEPLRLPPPRRERWAHTPPDISPPAVYRHRFPLPDARVVAIADNGLGILTDDELASLMLNPFALYDLFDVIDELIPEHWTEAMHKAARDTQPVRPNPTPNPVPRPRRRWQRVFVCAALVATLLIGIGLGVIAYQGMEQEHLIVNAIPPDKATGLPKREPDHGRDLALVALESQETRGNEKVVRARIACGFDGYATLVFPAADGSPLVLPGPGGNPIPVVRGNGLSAPLPPGARKARWAIVVVTEHADDGETVRKVLARGGAPGIDHSAEVIARYLREELGSVRSGRIAVGTTDRIPEEN